MKVNFRSLLHLFLGAFLMLAKPIEAHNVLLLQTLKVRHEHALLTL